MAEVFRVGTDADSRTPLQTSTALDPDILAASRLLNESHEL